MVAFGKLLPLSDDTMDPRTAGREEAALLMKEVQYSSNGRSPPPLGTTDGSTGTH